MKIQYSFPLQKLQVSSSYFHQEKHTFRQPSLTCARASNLQNFINHLPRWKKPTMPSSYAARTNFRFVCSCSEKGSQHFIVSSLPPNSHRLLNSIEFLPKVSTTRVLDFGSTSSSSSSNRSAAGWWAALMTASGVVTLGPSSVWSRSFRFLLF